VVGTTIANLMGAPLALSALVSTLAGNLTLLGSVANIIVLERAKERTEFFEYARIGLPVTIASTLCAARILWFQGNAARPPHPWFSGLETPALRSQESIGSPGTKRPIRAVSQSQTIFPPVFGRSERAFPADRPWSPESMPFLSHDETQFLRF
jgi:hypothetical protein